jgi:alkylation response protein AidB-like acyl-CoA dehydrogenase
VFNDLIDPAGAAPGRPPGVLGAPAPRFGLDRAAPDAAERTADVVRALTRDRVPAPDAPVRDTWGALAAIARADLAVARLVEGHVDAGRILAEAGRARTGPGVYGVWASASGGTGLKGRPTGDGGLLVEGTMRFCSGAWFLDRALVVVETDDGKQLLDVDVRSAQAPGGGMVRRDETWPAVGMDVSRSVDIEVGALAVPAADRVGAPGFYLDRPGFAAGGVGVAAVWLGGAAGVLDALVRALPPERAGSHRLAHLGVMAVALASADAVLGELAARWDSGAEPVSSADAGAARTAVELAAGTVLERAPRVSGPTPLCRDAAFAHRVADLEVYLRQHHAEADYEHLGAALLESRRLLGREFG